MQGRLDKVVSTLGLITRSEAQAVIRRGGVAVDGVPCRQPATKVDTGKQTVLLAGKALQGDGFAYLMLHKPAGVLSATEDKHGDPTVLDLLPEAYQRIGLGVVGRLDKDTEGLILLTDNGELNHRLTSPKYHADKRYLARLDLPADDSDRAAFAEGMDLGDFTTLPAVLEPGETPLEWYVTIREGKFHQVKRMFHARCKEVQYLKRLSIGTLQLDADLALGAFRPLTEEEKSGIFAIAGM
jgi:16S rRNA pseudouridine516 synthase